MSFQELETSFDVDFGETVVIGDNSDSKFWDTYQDNGNRRNYDYAFAGSGWTDELYDPKYPIVAESYQRMFMGNDKITNTKVPLDFSNYSYNGNENNNSFRGCSALKTIPSLKVGRKTFLMGSFDCCYALEHIGFNGELWCDISIQESEHLTDEMIINLVYVTKDFVHDEDEEIQGFTSSLYLAQNAWDRLWEIVADERFPEMYQGMLLGDILAEKGWSF